MKKIATDKAPAAIGPYSQAIVCNGMLYTSGQIAIDPAVGDIVAKDIDGQTEQVMQNLSAVLTAAGTDFTQVVKTTCFLADIADFAAFNAIYGKYFSEKPARSCVAAKALPKGALVEVEVIAVCPDEA
jgi:2-iminobutanoate/2-iminopropanoate deaminase